MDDCIFCKIIAGEIPSTKVYEDADTFAFLDISPIAAGHTLVIPRRHTADILETPDEVVAACMRTTRKLARAMMKCGYDGVNILQSNLEAAGQCVWHLHFHVIPRKSADMPPVWKSGAHKYADDAEREAVARAIADAAAQVKD